MKACCAALAISLLVGPVLAATPAAPPIFVDATGASGVDFVHFNGMTGELYYSETLGGGAALFDVDGDGDLDLYLVQGHLLGDDKKLADAAFAPRHPVPLSDRLYRNDLAVAADGSRTLRFTDITEASGLRVASHYGMGVTAGDFDNDGRVDLYVTNFGGNQLMHNRGAGSDGEISFADVTDKAGVGEQRWSVAAAFFDYDRDGWLDLFVTNYVAFRLATHRPCYTTSGTRDYCGPISYRPESDRLFRNRGDGTFEDVGERLGIAAAAGSSLGVSIADFDLDGWLDIYIANDELPNQLWMNRAGKSFEDLALLAGAAVNMEGNAESSMGIDVGDIDGDGDEDLFMTHLVGQTNTLYANDGAGFFEDASLASGLGTPSWSATGFGTKLFDYDNDGWLDVLSVNGAVKAREELARQKDPYPLHEPNQLFHNQNGRFVEVSEQAGAAFASSRVSRGAAFGDVDNDGDSDVVIVNNAGPAEVLLNQIGSANAWIGLEISDPRQRRAALGARVGVFVAGRSPLWRRVRVDGSYASANDPRVLVGLGGATRIDKVRVEWLGGSVEEWTNLPLSTYSKLERGSGKAAVASDDGGRETASGASGGGER